jgi:hypothetical protein
MGGYVVIPRVGLVSMNPLFDVLHLMIVCWFASSRYRHGFVVIATVTVPSPFLVFSFFIVFTSCP